MTSGRQLVAHAAAAAVAADERAEVAERAGSPHAACLRHEAELHAQIGGVAHAVVVYEQLVADLRADAARARAELADYERLPLSRLAARRATAYLFGLIARLEG